MDFFRSLIIALIILFGLVGIDTATAGQPVNVAPARGGNIDWMIGILQAMKAEGRTEVQIVHIRPAKGPIDKDRIKVARPAGVDTLAQFPDTIGIVVIEGVEQ